MTTLATSQPEASQKTAVRWVTLRRELLNFTWMLMELALITPIAFSQLPWGWLWSPTAFFLLLFTVMLLSFLLTRLMNQLKLAKPAQQNIIVLALLLTQLIIMRGIIYAPSTLFSLSWLQTFFSTLAEPNNQQWFFNVTLFVIVAFVWWRGLRMVGRAPEIEKAGIYLRAGGLIIAPFAIWLGQRLMVNITPFILLFFAAGLLTIALIRAEQLENSKSGRSAAVTPRWLTTILLTTVALILVALVMAAFLSDETTLQIVGLFTPIWVAITYALRVLGGTLLYLCGPFLAVLEQILIVVVTVIFAWILARILNITNRLAERIGFEPLTEPLNLEALEQQTSQTLDDKLIIMLLMVGVVLLVALAVRRAVRPRGFSDAQVRRGAAPLSADSQGALLANFRERFSELLNWRTAVSIRRTYRQMCSAAAGMGFPRGQAETPIEYLAVLRQAWPNHETETAVVTHAYIKIRYGEYPESAAELEEIRLAWQQLRQAAANKNHRQETAVRLQTDPEN